ncbi:HlyC/CorC family transporter [Psychrosphaera sp. B3R10]|uniref:HlyC/CorC family transporter n=1 Tax=unclassified Psychrosphaera TaxID=2641570 RepID=UPI001C0A3D21|nr:MULTISPECIES: HlyC/CorC family transporter [unclassified Psychrosphaera]MBU2881403.1 HlyC/CorC family transporter [Psychrosphaera sp. I2R16]MBU2989585.1 HlyC/CorC family transporter [Psychrosphaera sp. B3R10]MDO6719303.1 HlyC/CorC family transporter [Psychrosphaera sp. 1_MG-2023]
MDAISTSTLFIALAVLIFISAYFSSSETGLMAINKYRLKHLENQGHKGAVRVSKMMERPDQLIGLILIGNNLVNIGASFLAAEIGQRLYGDVGLAVAAFALTFIILIFAEVTPKTLAALHPEKVAFPSSIVLIILMKVLYPFVLSVNYITNGLLILLGISAKDRAEHSLSTEELRTVVNESGGLLQDNHQNMLVNLLDIENIKAEDIMIPRNEIYALDINDDWKDILKGLTNSQHTRLLLYRDNIDDAVGFIHVRDALRLLAKEDFSKNSLLRAVREIYFTPEGTSLFTLLQKLQQNKERIGLVVDEYGDIQGLFTLEDILEEIVGDFTTGMTVDSSFELEEQKDGSYVIDGSASIRDINKDMSWSLPTDGPKTINGLILEYMEDIPEPGVSIQIADYPIEIVEIKDNKVYQAKIYPPLEEGEET